MASSRSERRNRANNRASQPYRWPRIVRNLCVLVGIGVVGVRQAYPLCRMNSELSTYTSSAAGTGDTFLRGNETWAQAPCIPPNCLIQCAPKPLSARGCNPGPSMIPATLTCKRGEAIQTFHNIVFGIPEENVVACVPAKAFDFATIVPGKQETYIFNEHDEAEYARNYRASYYAYTWKKAGWDCLRHYEILASGALPFFSDLASAPPTVLTLLPKEMLLQGMMLPGVPSGIGEHIDHEVFPHEEYYTIACKALEYTRRYLTTKAIAQYVLKTMGKPHARKVLLLSSKDIVDYMRETIVHGMRDLLGAGAVEHPRMDYLYDYPTKTPPKGLGKGELYGQGYSYAHRLAETYVDRENLEDRIRQHEFDIIVYSCTAGAAPYLETVLEHYNASSIAVINGEDWRDWKSFHDPGNMNQVLFGKAFHFFRELPSTCGV